jgi:3alpha(or 20beta)-hydroxysteroid dehydrogenase
MTAQTAIVTGAASGIGRECTRMLLADGYRVAAIDLKAEAIGASFRDAGDKLVAISADIGDVEQCRAAVETATSKLGQLSAL